TIAQQGDQASKRAWVARGADVGFLRDATVVELDDIEDVGPAFEQQDSKIVDRSRRPAEKFRPRRRGRKQILAILGEAQNLARELGQAGRNRIARREGREIAGAT